VDIDRLRAVKKELYLNSFYHFAKFGLGGGFHQFIPRVQGPICKALQEDTKRKLICVPRGTLKSTIASVAYPMWRLEKEPNLRILLDSELYSNSKNFLREIKGHYETNVEFKNVFGDRVGPLWNTEEIVISTRTSPKKEASITCSGVEAGKTGMHYDIIIADDLSSYLNTKNPEVAKKTRDHYRLYKSLLEPDGTIVVIGTRYSELDIIGFVIENELEIPNQDVRILKDTYG
jgi:hypothetical protein